MFVEQNAVCLTSGLSGQTARMENGQRRATYLQEENGASTRQPNKDLAREGDEKPVT